MVGRHRLEQARRSGARRERRAASHGKDFRGEGRGLSLRRQGNAQRGFRARRERRQRPRRRRAGPHRRSHRIFAKDAGDGRDRRARRGERRGRANHARGNDERRVRLVFLRDAGKRRRLRSRGNAADVLRPEREIRRRRPEFFGQRSFSGAELRERRRFRRRPRRRRGRRAQRREDRRGNDDVRGGRFRRFERRDVQRESRLPAARRGEKLRRAGAFFRERFPLRVGNVPAARLREDDLWRRFFVRRRRETDGERRSV